MIGRDAVLPAPAGLAALSEEAGPQFPAAPAAPTIDNMQRSRDVVGVIGVVALTAGVAVAGTLSGDFRSKWYQELRKPAWQPSGRTIGAVWSVLYAAIAVSGSVLWLRRRHAGTELGPLFMTQSVLNAAWTPLFTRARRLDLAVADCAALTAVNGALVGSAMRTSRPAGLLLVPYLLWSAFATFLSWTLFRLNREPVRAAGAAGHA